MTGRLAYASGDGKDFLCLVSVSGNDDETGVGFVTGVCYLFEIMVVVVCPCEVCMVEIAIYGRSSFW